MLLFSPLTGLYAQDFSPSINIGGSFYPSRNLKDTTGSYSHQRAYIGFIVPLLKNLKIKDDGLKFYRISLGANAAMDNTQLSILPANRTFFLINTSLNGIYRSSRKSIWFAKFTASYFEDQTTIQNPSMRFSGFALYRRSVSETFFYMTGGAYSFSYGQGLPLPVLGMGWRFTNHASLTVILPFSVSYRFGKPASPFTVFIRPNGGVSNFYNDGLYANAAEKIVFRRKEFALGIKKKIRLSDQWSLLAETGLVTGRKIFFTNDFKRTSSSTIFESKVQTGPYISIGIKYKFKTNAQPMIQSDEIDLDSLMPN